MLNHMNYNSKCLSMYCFLAVKNKPTFSTWAKGSIAVSASPLVTLWEDPATELLQVKSEQQKRERLGWCKEKVKDESTRAVRAELKGFEEKKTNGQMAREQALQSSSGQVKTGELCNWPFGR